MQKSKYRDLRLGLQSSIYKQTKLFKKYNYPSWGIDRNINTPGEKVFIKKDTQATNWNKYLINNQVAGAFGNVYIVDRYKRANGIKGAKILKPQFSKVIVKVKNKPNHIKAVEHLGKYAQHKPLLNEVIKTLDFLDK